jgi:predicted DNA-binding transcriptional regulator AlpA
MSKEPMADPDLVQPKHEGGRQLGVSTRQIDRLIRDGALPVVELSPRRVGILQSDLDAFKISRRRVRKAASPTTPPKAAFR